MPTTLNRNGKAYDSGDVDIVIDGDLYPEVAAISYSVKQEHQKNKTLKNKSTSWSKGAITEEGSLTLMMDDATKLQKKGGGSVLGLKPFITTVSFANEDQEIVVDRITWKFASDGRDISGDMGLKMQYDMFVIDIEFNI